MKIIYAAYGTAGVKILKKLLSRDEISKNDIWTFTYDTSENSELLDLLRTESIKTTTEKMHFETPGLREFGAEYLISCYYRNIIPRKILDLVRGRAMNLHPSLLPDYKGCFSGPWAILNGEKYTGISYHLMEPTLDTGNILLQKKILLETNETAYSLYHRTIDIFFDHFDEAFHLLVSNSLGIQQTHSQSSRYFPRKVPFHGKLKASETTWDFAKRFVRAMHFPPFKGALFEISGREIEILDTDVLEKYKSYFIENNE